MAEVIFILTTLFVAYVIYAVSADQYSDVKSIRSKAQSSAKKQKESVEKASEPQQKRQPEPESVPTTVAASSAGRTQLKNPDTGEIAAIPNNYRFAKRWLKEALVREGLLEKVYKTNELDDDANQRIKAAIENLAEIPKYQA